MQRICISTTDSVVNALEIHRNRYESRRVVPESKSEAVTGVTYTTVTVIEGVLTSAPPKTSCEPMVDSHE